MKPEVIMSNKTASDDTPAVSVSPEEIKELGQKHPLSRFEGDLYREEDDITLPVIRVKRISTSNNIEKWKIMSDSKVICVIEGSKLSKKECEFLRGVDGTNWLLSRAKSGIKSFNNLKRELKVRLSPKITSKKKLK